jgi:hypothetical protein
VASKLPCWLLALLVMVAPVQTMATRAQAGERSAGSAACATDTCATSCPPWRSSRTVVVAGDWDLGNCCRGGGDYLGHLHWPAPVQPVG